MPTRRLSKSSSQRRAVRPGSITPKAQVSFVNCMFRCFVEVTTEVDALTNATGGGGAGLSAGACGVTGAVSETVLRSTSGGAGRASNGAPVLANGGGGPAGGLLEVGAPGSSKCEKRNAASACNPGVVGVRGTDDRKAAARKLSRKAGSPNRSA